MSQLLKTRRAFELEVDDVFFMFGRRYYVHSIEFGRIWYKAILNTWLFFDMSEFSCELLKIDDKKYQRRPERKPKFSSKFAHYGGKCKPVKCIETNETFPSTREAALCLGIDQAGISRAVNGKIKSTRGLSFVWALDTLLSKQ